MLKSRRSFAAAAVLLAVVEVLLDATTLIPLHVAILYDLPLVVAGFARDRRLLWMLTAVMIAATFIVYHFQTPPGAFSFREPLFVNRLLAVASLAVTAVLVHLLVAAFDAIEARAQADREASERKTRLLASVSHDIHTPLTAINLTAEMIRELSARPGAQVAELARNLQASALALTTLVADVLDASSFDSGNVSLHETEFALAELVAEECMQLAPAAQAKGLRLEVDESSAPLVLHADRVKLARILRNLVSNAIKFTSSGGVRLGWSLSAAGEAEIRVADTGRGIAPEHLSEIFADFARLNAPLREQAGWGLGLPICRRLAGLMGGSIAVESRPGRGSTFTLQLPASRVRRAEA